MGSSKKKNLKGGTPWEVKPTIDRKPGTRYSTFTVRCDGCTEELTEDNFSHSQWHNSRAEDRKHLCLRCEMRKSCTVRCDGCTVELTQDNCSPSQWHNYRDEDRKHLCLRCDVRKQCPKCFQRKHRYEFVECSDKVWNAEKDKRTIGDKASKLLCQDCFNRGYRLTRKGDGLAEFTCANPSCQKQGGRGLFNSKDLSNLQQKLVKQIVCSECAKTKRSR